MDICKTKYPCSSEETSETVGTYVEIWALSSTC